MIMRLVIVENNIGRAARLPKELLQRAGYVLMYQSEADYEASRKACAKWPFSGKLARIDAWSFFDTLDGLYAEESGCGPRYTFLMDLCLEDGPVAFGEKMSVTWLESKRGPEGPDRRCFVYEAGDRHAADLASRFGRQAVGTDMWKDGFLDFRSNAGLCRLLDLGCPTAGSAPKSEAELRSAVAVRAGEMENVGTDMAAARSLMDAYEKELAESTAALRKKHGYDAVEAKLRDCAAYLEAAADRQVRDRSFLVIGMMRELVHADPSVWEPTLEWLRKTFGIEVHYNSNVKAEKFDECFAAYAREVCSDDWWESGRHEMQSNGLMFLEQACPHNWSPCISVGVTESVLGCIDGFLEVCRDRLGRIADEWAARYVAENAMHGTKLAALRAALGGPDPEGAGG